MSKLWGGFTSNHLDMIAVDTGWGGYGTGSMGFMPAIFKNKQEARKRYDDVRPITVTILRNPKP